MGQDQSSGQGGLQAPGAISLSSFKILRNIGRGSFSKVAVVQKTNTKQLYAMKYISKEMCLEKQAFDNVLREVKLLSNLNHPFLVNLWFSFQDEEFLFAVFDLLCGGDLRYHLKNAGPFSFEQTKLYLLQMALALDYLHKKKILHRDVKPDNILLDEAGYAHLSDFNIATVIEEDCLATSFSGTVPYMAPEIFATSLHLAQGYSFGTDWWSLGITCYELLAGRRPYEIHSDFSHKQCHDILIQAKIPVPKVVDTEFVPILAGLLCLDSKERLQTIQGLQALIKQELKEVLRKNVQPIFIPPKDTINCDITYELEEMLIEDNTLQKRRNRRRTSFEPDDAFKQVSIGEDKKQK